MCPDAQSSQAEGAQAPTPCTPAWAQHRAELTMIWISLLQTCRSYSLLTYILFRAHFTPLLVLTRNTIAKPPMGTRNHLVIGKKPLCSQPWPCQGSTAGTGRALSSSHHSQWEFSFPCPSPELPALPGQLSPGTQRGNLQLMAMKLTLNISIKTSNYTSSWSCQTVPHCSINSHYEEESWRKAMLPWTEIRVTDHPLNHQRPKLKRLCNFEA